MEFLVIQSMSELPTCSRPERCWYGCRSYVSCIRLVSLQTTYLPRYLPAYLPVPSSWRSSTMPQTNTSVCCPNKVVLSFPDLKVYKPGLPAGYHGMLLVSISKYVTRQPGAMASKLFDPQFCCPLLSHHRIPVLPASHQKSSPCSRHIPDLPPSLKQCGFFSLPPGSEIPY